MPGRTGQPADESAAALFEPIWRLLSRPWLLLGAAGVLLLLLLLARGLPQLPGQYAADPVGASRWLLATRSEYGSLGSALEALGLFDFVHSLSLRVLLTLLSLLSLVHVGDLLGDALRYWRLPAVRQRPAGDPGEPLPIPGPGPVWRMRRALAAEPAAALERLRAGPLQDSAAGAALRLPLAPAGGPTTDQPTAWEERVVTVEARWAALLRPLAAVGFVFALCALWLTVNLGWSVAVTALAPGQRFHYAPRQLQLTYAVAGASGQATLEVTLDGVEERLMIAAGTGTRWESVGRLQMGDVEIRARTGPPGLLVSTQETALAIAGQNRMTDTVGLLFPGIGSEESLTLPQQEAGLRIVRSGSDETSFLVELFDSQGIISGQPAQRVEIQGRAASSIEITPGGPRLNLLPVAGLAVEVRAMPGGWLLWPALLMMLLGGAGWLGRPRFLVVQIAPWPPSRSVLVVQGDDEAQFASFAEEA